MFPSRNEQNRIFFSFFGKFERKSNINLSTVSEFFEPECLLNPPPMAEQFLHDIRRMIDMARERISARRYIPRMHPIFEVEGEEEMVVSRLSCSVIATVGYTVSKCFWLDL